MCILSRHVLRESIPPLCYCLALFTGIYVLFELFGSFSRLNEANLPAAEAIAYFGGYLSPFMHYLTPAALMLATLYTMWNLARHGEITAMLAGGASPLAIIAPLLISACAIALVTAWANEIYMPSHAQWARRLRAERFDLEKTEREAGFSYSNSADRRIWTVEGTHNRDCTVLTEVRISESRDDGTRKVSYKIGSARWLDGQWWMEDAVATHYDAREKPCPSPTPELDALKLRSFAHYGETPQDILMQNSDAQFASAAFKLRQAAGNPDLDAQSRNDLIYSAWAQAASPLACIIMTMIAMAGTACGGRRDAGSAILGALGAYFAYYGATIGMMAAAKTGAIAPVPAAVAPPLVFGAWAACRLAKKGVG